MLKSFSHIILSFLLLAATTGMAVSKHFCGDFLVSTTLFGEAEPCCDSGNCCRNESAFYQVDEDFSAPATAHIPQTLQVDLFITIAQSGIEAFGNNDEKSFYAERKPPPLIKIQTALSLKQTWLL
ncbi:MAG TPA: hypothetical protein ENN90_15275 [Mariniphaga anaerophila]|uniref:Secreted protein n=1 Tax=Mariniphaga anaerophila TaxID=1484053 RepID=A0A831PN37_9BACT|nr:hypothetical protein [Mariniphaga anaerophila]